VKREKQIADFATVEQGSALFDLDSIGESGESVDVVDDQGLFGRTWGIIRHHQGGEVGLVVEF